MNAIKNQGRHMNFPHRKQTVKKIIFIGYVSLVSIAALIYLDLRSYPIDWVSITNILIIALYSGFAFFAGWDLLSFNFEKRLNPIVRIVYYFPKSYLAIYLGIIYFPIWFFRKINQ